MDEGYGYEWLESFKIFQGKNDEYLLSFGNTKFLVVDYFELNISIISTFKNFNFGKNIH